MFRRVFRCVDRFSLHYLFLTLAAVLPAFAQFASVHLGIQPVSVTEERDIVKQYLKPKGENT